MEQEEEHNQRESAEDDDLGNDVIGETEGTNLVYGIEDNIPIPQLITLGLQVRN